MNDDILRAAGFQFSPQSTALVDLSRGRILACNRAFSVLLGYSEEELVDRPIDIIVTPAARQAMREALDATQTSPLLGHETTLELSREDGAAMNVRLRCRLVDETFTAPVRAVIAVDEITEAKDNQDAFFAMLAHELRNRLSNFRLAVQILERQDGPSGARWRWGLSVMNQQVAELNQLTDDLLDVSRMARGRLTLKRAAVDLTTVVRRAVEARQPSEDDVRGVPVVLDGPNAPILVRGDADRLLQVVVLLLDLATTPEATSLTLALAVGAGRARVIVRGPGIGRELFPHDLDLFAAAARAAAARPGLGLDPLLVAGLLERMDGTLAVGEQSVEVTLPMIAASEAPSSIDVPSEGASPVRSLHGPPAGYGRADGSTTASGRQILVVDDDRGAANTLALLLSTAGHTVEIAHSAEHALRIALERRPQVALLDLNMPRIDGYTLARRLRRDFGPALTIIALTGLDDPDDRARARAAGFDYHLVKPVDVDELKALLA